MDPQIIYLTERGGVVRDGSKQFAVDLPSNVCACGSWFCEHRDVVRRGHELREEIARAALRESLRWQIAKRAVA